jgi:hypothetical protein
MCDWGSGAREEEKVSEAFPQQRTNVGEKDGKGGIARGAIR